MRPSLTTLLICLCCLLPEANAEVIRQPTDLQRGDEYHLAFITSGTRTPSSADIEDYNEFVQNAADSAPIGDWGIKWFAVGATEAVSMAENVPINLASPSQLTSPTYLVDGSLLLTSSFSRPWNVTEFGVERTALLDGNIQVMTGFDWDGGATSFPLGSTGGTTGGFYTDVWPVWFYDGGNGGGIGPTEELPMYAISEMLIAVPEPSSKTLLLWLVPFVVPLRNIRKRT